MIKFIAAAILALAIVAPVQAKDPLDLPAILATIDTDGGTVYLTTKHNEDCTDTFVAFITSDATSKIATTGCWSTLTDVGVLVSWHDDGTEYVYPNGNVTPSEEGKRWQAEVNARKTNGTNL